MVVYETRRFYEIFSGFLAILSMKRPGRVVGPLEIDQA